MERGLPNVKVCVNILMVHAAIISYHHLGDAVICYNCVSMVTPGCGALLDHSKLLTSSSVDGKIVVNTATTEMTSSIRHSHFDDNVTARFLNFTQNWPNLTSGSPGDNSASAGVRDSQRAVGARGDGSNVVIECPGTTCLTQTIRTHHGDIHVRTCDVSSVTPGECNTVSQILGVPLSVVCTCTGDFCNTSASQAGNLQVLSLQMVVSMATLVTHMLG